MKKEIKKLLSKKKYAIMFSILAVVLLMVASVLLTIAVTEKESPHYISSLRISESKDIPDGQESIELHKLTNLTDENIKSIATKMSTGNITKLNITEEDGNVFFSVKMIDNDTDVEMLIDAGNGKLISFSREKAEKNRGEENEDQNK